jgi:hypothetical protein
VAFLSLLTAMFVNYKINNEGWGEVILIGLILTLDIITLPYKFVLFLRDYRYKLFNSLSRKNKV